jgi:hypothetical protein
VKKSVSAKKVVERRKIEHFDLNIPAWIGPSRDKSKVPPHEVQVLNISSNGVLIKTDDVELSTEQQVDLTVLISVKKITELFGIDDRVLLKVSGKILRNDPEGAAIAFSGKRSVCSAEEDLVFNG